MTEAEMDQINKAAVDQLIDKAAKWVLVELDKRIQLYGFTVEQIGIRVKRIEPKETCRGNGQA